MSGKAFAEFLQQYVEKFGWAELFRVHTMNLAAATFCCHEALGDMTAQEIDEGVARFIRNWAANESSKQLLILRELEPRLARFVDFVEFWPTEDDSDRDTTLSERVAFAQLRIDAVKVYSDVLRDIRSLTVVNAAELPDL